MSENFNLQEGEKNKTEVLSESNIKKLSKVKSIRDKGEFELEESFEIKKDNKILEEYKNSIFFFMNISFV